MWIFIGTGVLYKQFFLKVYSSFAVNNTLFAFVTKKCVKTYWFDSISGHGSV